VPRLATSASRCIRNRPKQQSRRYAPAACLSSCVGVGAALAGTPALIWVSDTARCAKPRIEPVFGDVRHVTARDSRDSALRLENGGAAHAAGALSSDTWLIRRGHRTGAELRGQDRRRAAAVGIGAGPIAGRQRQAPTTQLREVCGRAELPRTCRWSWGRSGRSSVCSGSRWKRPSARGVAILGRGAESARPPPAAVALGLTPLARSCVGSGPRGRPASKRRAAPGCGMAGSLRRRTGRPQGHRGRTKRRTAR
jgi:hypothetical protein